MELIKKLRLDPYNTVWTVGMPADVAALLTGLELRKRLSKTGPVEQLLFFAMSGAQLAADLPTLAGYIGNETLFWICYPKKTGAIKSDLIGMEPWNVVFEAGYRGQTSVSINDDWTGMRFTNAPRKTPSRADIPMNERVTEGIDYIHRTVTLPEDVLSVMNEHSGLTDFFYDMSFSHKREYMEAIADAKKPETRLRRIEKMVEMVLKLREEKELKQAVRKRA